MCLDNGREREREIVAPNVPRFVWGQIIEATWIPKCGVVMHTVYARKQLYLNEQDFIFLW